MRGVAFVAPLALLAACGGGGGSGSPPGGGGAPAPTPTPTPTPTPAVAFSAAGAGGLISVIDLDTSGDGQFGPGDASTRTTLQGSFGVGLTTAISGTLPSTASTRLRASLGVDAITGLVYTGLSAPAGATIVSPLTTLIDSGVSEQAARSALGLDRGVEILRPETGLLTFDPVANLSNSNSEIRNDAARLITVNLELLALAAIAKDTNGDPVDYSVPLEESSRYLAQVIAAGGSANLRDASVVRAVLEKSREAQGKPPEQLTAMSTLLARYFATMPYRINNADSARGWAYAFRFYILPELKILGSQWPNPEAARISAITDTDIRNEAGRFTIFAAPNVGGFIAVPDYRELSANMTTPYTLSMSGCSNPLTRSPACNDWRLYQGQETARVVSVGNFNSAQISVSVSADGTVLLARANNYVGPSSFTYVSRAQNGEESTGFVFVTVR
ncbi:hypothetical protein G6N82_01410 [Altererythrobacter sp. BO-6]|nr:hypothetical protein G6N82_01410 [Altererythrobacter sp. BO-6]